MSAETPPPFFASPRGSKGLRALDENTPLTLKLGVLLTLAATVAVSAIAWNNVRRDVEDHRAALAKLEARADHSDELLRDMRERMIRIEAKLDNLSR